MKPDAVGGIPWVIMRPPPFFLRIVGEYYFRNTPLHPIYDRGPDSRLFLLFLARFDSYGIVEDIDYLDLYQRS